MVDWADTTRLLQAAQSVWEKEGAHLESLLKRTREQFDNFPDPFEADYGAHRWLRRETAYSDWLGWILERIKDYKKVLELFDVSDVFIESKPIKGDVRVKREVTVPFGDPGHMGFLDLVVYCGDKAVLVLEVKVTDANTAYLNKQIGYRESIDRIFYKGIPAVLLVTSYQDEDRQNIGDFKLRKWGKFIQKLRKLIWQQLRAYPDARALIPMTLAFVGAVEQYLLRMPFMGPPSKSMGGYKTDLCTRSGVSRHLRETLPPNEHRIDTEEQAMSNANRQLLDDGLEKYPKVVEALESFKEAVKAVLDSALSGDRWQRLVESVDLLGPDIKDDAVKEPSGIWGHMIQQHRTLSVEPRVEFYLEIVWKESGVWVSVEFGGIPKYRFSVMRDAVEAAHQELKRTAGGKEIEFLAKENELEIGMRSSIETAQEIEPTAIDLLDYWTSIWNHLRGWNQALEGKETPQPL